MNDAVQVKGLFISPPGSIWSGFNTTFEGEDRPFQATGIPFYINEVPNKGPKVIARIYNAQNEQINTVEISELTQGLNYISWKLDEQIGHKKANTSSREIPVLSGVYKIVLEFNGKKDSTEVNVIPNPRFDIPTEVDEQLYNYQKSVYSEKARLDAAFEKLDSRTALLDKMEKYYTDLSPATDKEFLNTISAMKEEIKTIREKGRPTAGNRQVGAWQTLAVNPHSNIQAAEMTAMSRHVEPSEQDWNKITEAKQIINTFSTHVDAFIANSWKGFEE
jgi:hypothetical protein